MNSNFEAKLKLDYDIITEQQKEYKHYSGFSFADCCKNPQAVKWVLKGYIPEKSLCMIFGASGSFKSFIAYDMAASIACDEIRDWHGQRIKHGDVVIFAGEGSEGIKLRFAGWAEKYGINPENVRLHIFDEVFKLDGNELEHDIETTINNVKAVALNPILVIFDTLNCYMGGEENSATDTGRFIGLCKKVIKELQTAVCIIHHTGNADDAKDRARGSSALRGALDSEMKVKKISDLECVLQQTKSKDAAKVKDTVFTLERVILPSCLDEEGWQVDTLVPEKSIEKTELYAQTESTPKEKKLRQSEITAKETYQKASEMYGSIQTDKQTGSEMIITPVEKWRQIFFENSSAENDSTRRGQFSTARKILLEEKHILQKRKLKNIEFYCLVLTDGMPVDISEYANEIKTTIILRDQREKEAGNFDERTGNLF